MRPSPGKFAGASSNAQRGASPKGKRMTEKAERIAGGPKGSEMPQYEPNPSELKAAEAYRAARAKAAPSVKVEVTGKNEVDIRVDHPDRAIGGVALMQALGTTDPDFYNGLLSQLVNASRDAGSWERGANFMLSVIKGIEPRDQIEAMLVAQIAAVHMASMTFARRLAHVDTFSNRTVPRMPSTSWLARSQPRSRL